MGERLRVKGVALFLLFLSPFTLRLSPVRAEEIPLLLSDLLMELRQANPDLLAAHKRLEAAQARIPQARGLPPPRIGIEFEEIPRGTVKLDKASTMFQLIQSLPFPGKLSLKQKVALKEAQVAAVEFKRAEWELLTQLKSIYYDLFLLDREVEIQEERILWLEQAEGSARARYASGLGPQSDLLRAQAELAEAQNEKSVLAHRRQAMGAHLNHLLNRPAEAPLGRPDEVPFLSVPSTPQGLLSQAEQVQPELLAFKFSAERAEAVWKLSKRELWPDLETMFELRDPASGPIGPWDLTLALVLPFWFWTKQKYGVRAALYDKESAALAHQGARNEAARQIHEHWHEAQAAFETVRLCRDRLLPLSEQGAASALAAYQGGKGSFVELMDALVALKERQRTYYQHLVALEQHIVMLEQSVGVPLRATHEEKQGEVDEK